jgi:hypothetical protein
MAMHKLASGLKIEIALSMNVLPEPKGLGTAMSTRV